MKLKINGFANEFEFNDDKVNILVIKNTKYFSNIIQKLNNRINEVDCDEIFLLNDNDEELKIQKEMSNVAGMIDALPTLSNMFGVGVNELSWNCACSLKKVAKWPCSQAAIQYPLLIGEGLRVRFSK